MCDPPSYFYQCFAACECVSHDTEAQCSSHTHTHRNQRTGPFPAEPEPDRSVDVLQSDRNFLQTVNGWRSGMCKVRPGGHLRPSGGFSRWIIFNILWKHFLQINHIIFKNMRFKNRLPLFNDVSAFVFPPEQPENIDSLLLKRFTQLDSIEIINTAGIFLVLSEVLLWEKQTHRNAAKCTKKHQLSECFSFTLQ